MNRKIAFGFWLMAFGFLPAAAQRVLPADGLAQQQAAKYLQDEAGCGG